MWGKVKNCDSFSSSCMWITFWRWRAYFVNSSYRSYCIPVAVIAALLWSVFSSVRNILRWENQSYTQCSWCAQHLDLWSAVTLISCPIHYRLLGSTWHLVCLFDCFWTLSWYFHGTICHNPPVSLRSSNGHHFICETRIVFSVCIALHWSTFCFIWYFIP